MNKKVIALESSKKRKYDKTIFFLRNISNQLDVMKKKVGFVWFGDVKLST